MNKGIEMSFILAIEAEVKQIAICVESIQVFLKVVKSEAEKLEEDAEENEKQNNERR